MIDITASISGSEIGRELRSDPEELAACLVALRSTDPKDLAEECFDYMSEDEAQKVKEFLTAFAAALGYRT